jgi:hypothetical protein
MADIELLRRVVPSIEGWYCVVGIDKNDKVRQNFYQTLEEVEAHAELHVANEFNAFFALGKFKTKENRTAANCGWMQSFFLDIDCGPSKATPDKHGRIRGYIDQTTGLQAVKDLCAILKLPRPTVVDSGRGWHVYWPLTQPVEVEKWLPVAQTFKARCVEANIIIDPDVPADPARVLRIPNTKNFKDDPALDVVLMQTTEPMLFDDFAALMGPLVPTKPVHQPKQLDDFTKAMLGNRQSRFKTILDKTMQGDGCAQLEYIAENQEAIEEPLWRAGLSIAKHCVDGDKAIHIISKLHPSYNPAATEKKAQPIKGPYTCETFNDFRPGVCTSCPHWGKLKSPITLGHEIARAEPDEPIPVVGADGITAEFVVPAIPSLYFRGRNGGIYKTAKKGESDGDTEDGDEDKIVCVYEYDLFVMKRMFDPSAGETILMRLSLPRDGSKEFTISTEDLLSKDEFRKKVSFYGVLAKPGQMANILNYVIDCAREMQVSQEVEMMRLQFGWTEENDRFILGSREIGPSYTRYSPPSRATSKIAPHLHPHGDFEEWKKIINVYNMPGFEPHAFAVASAFGAPLLKFMGVNGSIINLVNNRSGTGKSTILQVMNSVWGHPNHLMLQWKDTLAVKLHRMAVMNNLPLGVDEVTKMTGDDFSDLAYSVTQGAPRRRMKASADEERESQGFWSTIMVTTSNASMTDKLQALKSTSEGELMRLMQYRIDPTSNLDKSEAKHIFGGLQTHYGLAGSIYGQYLVQNLEEVIDNCMRTQAKFDGAAKIDTPERFWSATAAANLTGCAIAKNLGLWDIVPKRVFDWAVHEVGSMQVESRLGEEDYAATVGEFLLKHNANTLIINRHSTSKSGIAATPIVQPRAAIIVRYEPDTKLIQVLRSSLKEFCVSRQITFSDLLDRLHKEGSFVESTRARIDSGTDMQSPPVEVLVFDADKLGVAPSGGDED